MMKRKTEIKNTLIAFLCEVLFAVMLTVIEIIKSQVTAVDENVSIYEQPMFRSWLFWLVIALIPILTFVLSYIKEKSKEDSFRKYIDSIVPVSDNYEPLHFRNNLLGFIGRKHETEILESFLNDNERLLWMGVVGDGGMGKSKFARNFTQKITIDYKNSWKVLWIKGENIEKILEYDEWRYPKNLLLIYDYAGISCEKVSEWIYKLDQLKLRKKIRVLMLEREDANKDKLGNSFGWYSHFLGEGDTKYAVDKHKYKNEKIDETGLLKLEGFDEEDGISLINAYIKSKRPDIIVSKDKLKDLYDKSCEIDTKSNKPKPLYILLTVDAWLEKSEETLSIEKLVDYVIKRHENHWKKTVCEENEEVFSAVIELLCYATACGGWSLEESINMPELEAARKCLIDTKRAAGIIKAVNMGEESGVLMPLEPDLIGELFVLQKLLYYKNNNPDYLKAFLKLCWEKTDDFYAFLVRCRQNYGSVDTFNDIFSLDKHFFEVWREELVSGKVNMPLSVYNGYCDFVFVYTWMEPREVKAAIDILKYYNDTVKYDEIKYTYAIGIYNHTVGSDLETIKKCAEKLRELSEESSSYQDEIKLEYAKSLGNLAYTQNDINIGKYVEVLRKLSEENGSCQDEIKQQYAYSLLIQSSLADLHGREKNAELLKNLSEESGRCQDKIKLQYAKGLVYLTEKQDLTYIKKNVELLRLLSEQEGSCQDEIKYQYAHGLQILVSDKKNHDRAKSLEILRNLSEENGKYQDEITVQYALSLVSYMELEKNISVNKEECLNKIKELSVEDGKCQKKIELCYGNGLLIFINSGIECDIENCVENIKKLYEDNGSSDDLFALFYAMGLSRLADTQNITEAEQSVEILRGLSENNGSQKDSILVEYATGITYLMKKQVGSERKVSISILENLSQKRCSSQDRLKLVYAFGLDILNSSQGKHEYEKNLQILKALSEEEGMFQYNIKSLYAIHTARYILKQSAEEANESIEILKNLSEEKAINQYQMKVIYADGLVNLISKQKEIDAKENVALLKRMFEEDKSNECKLKIYYVKGMIGLCIKQRENDFRNNLAIIKKMSEESDGNQDEIKMLYAYALFMFINKLLKERDYLDSEAFEALNRLSEEDGKFKDKIVDYYKRVLLIIRQ